MLSSEDPIFASNFLHQFIKRNNIRHVNLRNLVLLKFEDYMGVDEENTSMYKSLIARRKFDGIGRTIGELLR